MTDRIDTISPRTRRAVLTGAIGAAAAAAAASISRVTPAEGADGDPVVVGNLHFASSTTEFRSNADIWVLRGVTNAIGVGVMGVATADGVGVLASSRHGRAINTHSDTGHALRVEKGRVRFDGISGIATIRRGRRTVTVAPGVDINAATFVLLTPMSNIGSRGLWFWSGRVTAAPDGASGGVRPHRRGGQHRRVRYGHPVSTSR